MQSKICQAFICYNFDILMIMIMKTQNYFFSVFFCGGEKQQKNVKKSEKTSLAPWAIDKKKSKKSRPRHCMS